MSRNHSTNGTDRKLAVALYRISDHRQDSLPPQLVPASDTCAPGAGFVRTTFPACPTGAAHSNSPRGRKACYPAEAQGETVFSSLAF
jgi:hypothetical protein